MKYGKPLNAGEKALGKVFEGMGGGDAPKRTPTSSEPDGGEGGGEGDEELPPGFEDAGSEFLDATLPMPDRLRALKRAIHLCTESY